MLVAVLAPKVSLPSHDSHFQHIPDACHVACVQQLQSYDGRSQVSDAMLAYVFEQCKLLDWLVGLPTEVRPTPRPGDEEATASRPPLRAGYMGHVTQIASTLESFSAQPRSSTSSDAAPGTAGGSPANVGEAQSLSGSLLSVPGFLGAHTQWQAYVEMVLHPRQELENTSRWACGRPTATELAGLDSDTDEFQVSAPGA
jgi:serine/threonine-protein phosphatase 6 regulatory subunit 3